MQVFQYEHSDSLALLMIWKWKWLNLIFLVFSALLTHKLLHLMLAKIPKGHSCLILIDFSADHEEFTLNT